MPNRRNRYQEMEFRMFFVLLADVLLFIFYLIAAGNGIVWLKVIIAIIAIIISGLCLIFLYLTQEISRPRSLWMTATAGAVLVCIVFSLLLNFPSPHPRKQLLPQETNSATQTTNHTQ